MNFRLLHRNAMAFWWLLFSVIAIKATWSQYNDEVDVELHEVDIDDWTTECFVEMMTNLQDNFFFINKSNHFFIDQPAGLCADFLTCAYEKCYYFGFDDPVVFALAQGPGLTYDQLPTETFAPLNMPSHIAFPTTASEVVRAVRAAKMLGKTVSIKSTGHSYTGSSTMADSLQLNLRSLIKYSQEPEPVKECMDVDLEADAASNEYVNPCKLALARGKQAVMKVGGGEIWSDVYLAVDDAIEYASQGYHVVGGGAGTVGAAGGWLHGGGWSTGAERLYGLGVDQVLEIEMVLSDARHVRFGPTEWEGAEGFLYPKTTKVEGWCNTNVVADESQWTWEPCEEPVPPFADLWFAVRGGGGGTFGVLTALKYQLHEARPMQFIGPSDVGGVATIAALTAYGAEAEAITARVNRLWIMFLVDFLYNPANLGIDEETSNLCGGPALNFAITSGTPFVICYDEVLSTVLLPLWQALVDAQTDLTLELRDQLKILFGVIGEARSYAQFLLMHIADPLTPPGKLPDLPLPSTTPTKGYGGWCSAIIPEWWLAEGGDGVYALLSNISGEHVTGGVMAVAHDQMNAISDFQRASGLSSMSLSGLDDDTIGLLFSTFLEGAETLPGISEINHICTDSYGPLRSNFTQPCPSDWTIEEKEENCYSIQESLFGSEIFEKLVDIKTSVDPENLFDCYPCIKPKELTGMPPKAPPVHPPPD